jgi:PIF1-like helicase
VLTEKELETYEKSRMSWREEQYGIEAIAIARSKHVFPVQTHTWQFDRASVGVAVGGDMMQLERWKQQMLEDAAKQDILCINETEIDDGIQDVQMLEDMRTEDKTMPEVELIANTVPHIHEQLPAVDASHLLPSQRQAYDIVDWHLQETLAGRNPPQLLMTMVGEGGTGKSQTIQTMTENFRSKSTPLIKSAYTGIAASIIGGKTIHSIAMVPLNGLKQSAQTLKKLESLWQDKQYLIIDEISMVSRKFFARLSNIIGRAKAASSDTSKGAPFGGVNVIVVGDFHQFPPIACKKNAPLFWPCDEENDTEDEILGRRLFEKFEVVVILKEQKRVEDTIWHDLLKHVRYGKCREQHLKMLRQLIITNSDCPPTDFSRPPWNKALLVTPRHSVRMQWNMESAIKECALEHKQLYHFQAQDSISGRPVTLRERFLIANSNNKGSKNRKERGGLPDVVDLCIGMKVMVTFNIRTDLDVSNGSRGEIVDIVLDERESTLPNESIVRLTYPPLYVLVRLTRTKASALEGLAQGIIPITPIERTYSIHDINGMKQTITRLQLPMTSGWAFTDIRSQGQTIDPVVVDIGRPPSGHLTPFNAYVALSRGRSRESVRLLRDFDDTIFTVHPCEYLRREDSRLQELDRRTQAWWRKIKSDNR